MFKANCEASRKIHIISISNESIFTLYSMVIPLDILIQPQKKERKRTPSSHKGRGLKKFWQ